MPATIRLPYQRQQKSVTGRRWRQRLGFEIFPRHAFADARDGHSDVNAEHGSPLVLEFRVDALDRLFARLLHAQHGDALRLQLAGELRVDVADAQDEFLRIDIFRGDPLEQARSGIIGDADDDRFGREVEEEPAMIAGNRAEIAKRIDGLGARLLSRSRSGVSAMPYW